MDLNKEQALKEALEKCDKERIHEPEAIQPHGFMLVIDFKSYAIIKASLNTSELFDRAITEVLHIQVSDIFNTDFIGELELLPDLKRASIAKPKLLSCTLMKKDFDALCHRNGDCIILELEEKTGETKSHDSEVLQSLGGFSNEILKCSDESDLHGLFASHIRRVTQFDRTKVYQFDANWNGQIISENKLPHMESFMGLNFPASDIPSQARELYKKNLIRIIVDSHYQPSHLVAAKSGKTEPVDMSFADLRSVSPIHLKYMQNMQVGASMSISIVHENRLWGLVVCHHASPHFVSSKIRMLAEVMTHIYSARLSAIIESKLNETKAHHQVLLSELKQRTKSQSAESILESLQDIAIKGLKADGFIIFGDKSVKHYGEVPDIKLIEDVRNWYLNSHNFEVVFTDDVQQSLNNKGIKSNIDGGVLILPLGIDAQHFIMWYRKAVVQEVSWGGKPKELEQTDDGFKLSPRNSFELWKAEVKSKSRPWDSLSVKTADSIAKLILDGERHNAEEASIAKTQFLSQMSHELRTPLSAISSIIQILREEDGLAQHVKTLISSLDMSSNSLMALINDLLDLDRVESNAVQIEMEVFALNEVIEEVRSVMLVQAQNKGLSLNVQYGENTSLKFRADRGKIRQVLFNIVGNAIKFTDLGFVNIHCNVSVDEEDADLPRLKITVTDSGPGIHESQLERVFDKFHQADNSISRKFGGSGLGLSICKSLITLMKGSIDVTSKEGMGTMFTVSLPVNTVDDYHKRVRSDEFKSNPLFDASAPLSSVKTESKPSSNLKAPPIKILLVEDYEGNIVAVTFFLQSKGFDVSIANNGQEALSILEKDSFDLILMDVQMPIMDGLTATSKIRQEENDKGLTPIPILGMTANAIKQEMHVCIEAGMDDYIIKPLKLDDLLNKVKSLVAKSSLVKG